MSTAIQSIFIRGYEDRPTPKPHTVYRIDIQATVRNWQMWRRYSEFDDLHTELSKSCGAPPPASLPPKHPIKAMLMPVTLGMLSHGERNKREMEERREGLEVYLRAILSAKDERWRESYAFKEFLGVPVGRQQQQPLLANAGVGTGSFASTSAPQYTPASWLDEHAEIQSRLRDVWADLNKRDALSGQGEVAEAHKSNVGAKRKLAGVSSRIGSLARGLGELGMAGMSEGELQRRTDMVARLQDDCEKLHKLVSVVVGRAGAPAAASDQDREALLGGAPAKPARRVFGAPAKETEVTRPLDNVGILNLQEQQVQQQDNQLAQLTTILQRQRQLGEAIGAEVAQQIELLNDLDTAVDRTGDKLHRAKTALNKVS